MTRIVKLSDERFSLNYKKKLAVSMTALLITGAFFNAPSYAGETQRVTGEVTFLEVQEAEEENSLIDPIKKSEKNPYTEIQIINNKVKSESVTIQKNDEKPQAGTKAVNIVPNKAVKAKPVVSKPVEKESKTTNFHTVSKGDTLSYIAQKYNVDLRNLASANRITNIHSLQLGQKLVIPAPGSPASRTTLASRSISAGGGSSASGRMTWPTAAGKVSSNYGMRWGRMHKGLDIAAPVGTSIKAAFGGKVTFAGWGGAYGNLIVIEHANGLTTKYGHCSKLYVRSGQEINAGQLIGAVGSTGRSTGPHLHFETVLNGTHIDPRKFL